MPMIIDVTGKNTRAINSAADALAPTQGLLLGLIERRDRQEAERQRLGLADREFAYRQQQADRQAQFQERGFDQRQQLIDREVGQEDAAARFYQDRLAEMNPGPVAANQFAGMDPNTLKGVYDAALYEQKINRARTQATTAWRQNLLDMGIEDPNDPMAQQVGMLIQNAATLEDLEQARQAAYSVYAEAEATKRDGQFRAATVEQTMPMRMVLQTRPREAAAAAVLDRQFMNGDLTFKDYWTAMGDVMEAASGGGGERPTVDRISFGKGQDALAGRLAAGEMTVEEFNRQRSILGAALGIEGFTAPGPDGAEVAGKLPPAEVSSIRAKVGEVSDRPKKITRAANMIDAAAAKAGLTLTEDERLALIEQVVN